MECGGESGNGYRTETGTERHGACCTSTMCATHAHAAAGLLFSLSQVGSRILWSVGPEEEEEL